MSSSTPFYARQGLIAAPGTRTVISTGNSAQRPSSPSPGEIRYNTDLASFEFWFAGNTTWASPSSGIPSNLALIALTANTIGANSVSVGNSSVNTVVTVAQVQSSNSTVSSNLTNGLLTIGANLAVNTSGFGIGNSTVSVVTNSTLFSITDTNGVHTVNSTVFSIGNSTVNATVNSTTFTGTALSSNNSAFLGGVAAASYATTSSLSAYQTTAGLSANVAKLASNNAAYLGGVAAANYWLSTGTGALTNLNQLTNGPGYITSASIPTNISAFTNNVGYITGLSSGGTYSVYILSAGNYLYSAGNVLAAGDVYASYSDIRLKKLKKKVKNALDVNDQLQGWYFERNDHAPEIGVNTGRMRVGLIAQDVQKVIPEAVVYIKNEDGEDTEFLTINHDMIIPFLVESIKELRAELKALRGH